MAFFLCEQATKWKYSILCVQLKQHTIHSLKKEALRVGFQERPCYTPAVTLLHTQNTTCEQLQRQQLMKWPDGVLSEDVADKKKNCVAMGISGQVQWCGVLQKGRMAFSLCTKRERPWIDTYFTGEVSCQLHNTRSCDSQSRDRMSSCHSLRPKENTQLKILNGSKAGWSLNMDEPGLSLWVNQIPDTELVKTEGVKEGAAKQQTWWQQEATSALGSSVHHQKYICRPRASTEDLTSAQLFGIAPRLLHEVNQNAVSRA